MEDKGKEVHNEITQKEKKEKGGKQQKMKRKKEEKKIDLRQGKISKEKGRENN